MGEIGRREHYDANPDSDEWGEPIPSRPRIVFLSACPSVTSRTASAGGQFGP